MSYRIISVAAMIISGGLLAACNQSVGSINSSAPVSSAMSSAKTSGVQLKPLAHGFREPLQVVDAGRGYLWVVEKGGRIVVVKGRGKVGLALDVSKQVSDGGEQGLLGVVKQGGYAYVYLTNRDGDSELWEYPASSRRLNPAGRRLLLRQGQPEANHNGGSLLVGPDGYLYLGLGDGGGAGDQHGSRGNAQDLNSLLGKVLRIDPRHGDPYAIPKDNPFIGRGRGEIYHYGLRNPWRMSFDSDGNLWIGDVGQESIEEINRYRGGGANFGWRVFEGDNLYNPGEEAAGAVKPTYQYRHQNGRCSVVGGQVVSDRRLSQLYGHYLFSDTCDGQLRYLIGGHEQRLGVKVASPVSIDRDRRGQIYISSLEGQVWRLRGR